MDLFTNIVIIFTGLMSVHAYFSYGLELRTIQPCWDRIQITRPVQVIQTTTKGCGLWGMRRCQKKLEYTIYQTNFETQCCLGYESMPDCDQLSISSDTWLPQMGTIQYPKVAGEWSFAHSGDIVSINGDLYMANEDVALGAVPNISSPDFDKLEKGTIRRPKDPDSDVISNLDEVFYDDSMNMTYVSNCTNYTEIYECLSPIDIKENWMTLLNPFISKKRLGDLTWPGSHDSATKGIDRYSHVIATTTINELANMFGFKQALVNWSITQTSSLKEQLEAGVRFFDLRIAYVNETVGAPFYWWHAMTADTIEQGLDEIAEFAATHPQEIILLEFFYFSTPGDDTRRTNTMSRERLTELNDILVNKLAPVAVNKHAISGINPTVKEVLDTGGNVIMFMHESYLQRRSALFWSPKTFAYRWIRAHNPEYLFNTRSYALQRYKRHSSNVLTKDSVAITLDERFITASLTRSDIPSFILDLFTDKEVDPERMSFEGLWDSLVDVARYGTNTMGMHARNPALYSNGVSVHYKGANEMYRHWLSRPDKCKPSIIKADDVVESSTLVDTAILFNMGELKREVSITYQGTPTHGKYELKDWIAENGTDAYKCELLFARIDIISENYNISDTYSLHRQFQITFIEGQYPEETTFNVFMGSTSTNLYHIVTGQIQTYIEGNLDLYIRGSAVSDVTGFAYTSYDYALYTETCSVYPGEGTDFEVLIIW